MQRAPFNMVGPKCIEIGENCLGDTQDTFYQYTLPVPITDAKVYAAVGTLGTRTGTRPTWGWG